MTARHRWISKSRPDHLQTQQTCTHCGIARVTRHEGARHWVEFYDDAGMSLGSGRTPGCERKAVAA